MTNTETKKTTKARVKKTASFLATTQCKRKYDSEDSKRRLLEAGVHVFSKEGFDAATTREVAKRAGVNESLIHRYFKNKLGLFFEILKQFHLHLTEFPTYPAGNDLEEELNNFFKYRVSFFRKEMKFFKLGVTQAILNPKVREEMGLLHRNSTPGLVHRLHQLREEGKIRKDISVDSLAVLLGGIAFSITTYTGVVFDLNSDLGEKILALASKLLAEGLAPRK